MNPDRCVNCGRFTFKDWLYCQKCADEIGEEYMNEPYKNLYSGVILDAVH